MLTIISSVRIWRKQSDYIRKPENTLAYYCLNSMLFVACLCRGVEKSILSCDVLAVCQTEAAGCECSGGSA